MEQRPRHSTLDVLDKWFEDGSALSVSHEVNDSENYPCADAVRGETTKVAFTSGVISDADTLHE